MLSVRAHTAVAFCLLALACVISPAGAQDLPALRPGGLRLNDPASGVALRARAELGAISVVSHRIQYGRAGTRVDYRDDADQDTLFFFARLSAEVELNARHTLVFLYQPLTLQTEAVLARQLRVGEVVFPRETPLRFGYGFDFYRIAYQYDVFSDARRELAFGVGFQVRNARIAFLTSDGTRGFTQTNLGIVPLLRVRGRYVFDNALFLESEIDGWISPVPNRDETGKLALGAILDASIRVGAVVTQWSEVYLNLRYLGGGFRGDNSEPTPLTGGNGWSSNWLHTVTVSLGLGLR